MAAVHRSRVLFLFMSRALLWGLVLLAGVTILIAVVPGLLNRQLMVVNGGSMAPAFAAGDLVLTKPVRDSSPDVRSGDVVVILSSTGVQRAHRVVEVRRGESGETMLRTAGDANGNPDATWTSARDIGGIVVTSFPHVGLLLGYLARPIARLVLFVLPLLYLASRELVLGLRGEGMAEAASS